MSFLYAIAVIAAVITLLAACVFSTLYVWKLSGEIKLWGVQ